MRRIAPDVARKLLSRLQAVKRAAAVEATCEYLDQRMKQASDSQQLAYRTIQESLKAGATLGGAIKVAMPWMSPVDVKNYAETLVKAASRCWKGYEPTPGKEAYSRGSCQPVAKKEKTEEKQSSWIEQLAEKAAMLNASATGDNMPAVKTMGEQSFTGSIADGSSFLGSM